MQVRIDSHIRGEHVRIVWSEGTVTGDLELVERARRLHRIEHGGPIDEADPVAFLTALGHASCEELSVRVLEGRRPEPDRC